MSENVGIVIVSHSTDVAKGASSMAKQMVGEAVSIAWCGGTADGSLGTDVEAIKKCIDEVCSEAGVAILVDLGGAEMNTEMAIEMLDETQHKKVKICNAAIVEGTVMAATEASIGGTLEEVIAAAEEAI